MILYSGYYLGELREMQDVKTDEILSMLDVLIDGPYIEELNDGISLRGSSNQGVHFLTDRYTPYRELYSRPVRRVEMHMTGNGISIIGVPDKTTLETLDNLPMITNMEVESCEP